MDILIWNYFVGRFYQCWWNVSLYSSVYWMSVFILHVRKDKVMLQIFVGMFLAALITIFNPLIMETVVDKDRMERSVHPV